MELDGCLVLHTYPRCTDLIINNIINHNQYGVWFGIFKTEETGILYGTYVDPMKFTESTYHT